MLEEPHVQQQQPIKAFLFCYVLMLSVKHTY